MSFLAPFYLLAGLAIGLPIAFHMIRRTPQGRLRFSSTMFLSPSPPRMTKRSRIEDWILLLLRGLAICLLAFAFARPFLRAQASALQQPGQTQRITILLDRSASMQRPGYWDRALQELERILTSSRANNAGETLVQVAAFDLDKQSIIEAEEWSSLSPDVRVSTTLDRARKVQPGWLGTNGGQILLNAADELESDSSQASSSKKIVLISDLQAGGGWATLNGSNWPENVSLQIVDVSQSDETNAAIQFVVDPRRTDAAPRVRVVNAANSAAESFQLGWADEFAATSQFANPEKAVTTYIPPGESRIVVVPLASEGKNSSALLLQGDSVAFDNVCYAVPAKPKTLQIVSFGSPESANLPSTLRFFLAPLFPSDATRKVEIIDWDHTEQPEGLAAEGPSLVILGETPNQPQLDWLKNWVQLGGQLLFVAQDPDQGHLLYDIVSAQPVEVVEAEVKAYAMLGRVDLDHPVMRPFNDPRFSDFTKLRFWKYRHFDAASFPGMRTLAAMENGDPVIAEIPAGKGRVILFAAGWTKADSDLALWSKFVPLMNGLLEYLTPAVGPNRQMLVGDEITVRGLGIESEAISMRFRTEITSVSQGDSVRLIRPGLYHFTPLSEQPVQYSVTSPTSASSLGVTVAVNVSPEESRTEPYPQELFAAAGIPVVVDDPKAAAAAPAEKHQRQLLNLELESRQQWWRWLLVVAIAILFGETLLAAWKSRVRGSLESGNTTAA